MHAHALAHARSPRTRKITRSECSALRSFSRFYRAIAKPSSDRRPTQPPRRRRHKARMPPPPGVRMPPPPGVRMPPPPACARARSLQDVWPVVVVRRCVSVHVCACAPARVCECVLCAGHAHAHRPRACICMSLRRASAWRGALKRSCCAACPAIALITGFTGRSPTRNAHHALRAHPTRTAAAEAGEDDDRESHFSDASVCPRLTGRCGRCGCPCA
jgi:hypothetical protein